MDVRDFNAFRPERGKCGTTRAVSNIGRADIFRGSITGGEEKTVPHKRIVPAAAACAAAIALTLTGCGGGDEAQPQPTPTVSIAPPTAETMAMVGTDFPQLLEVGVLPQPSPEAVEVFGVESAQQGALWAVGLAQETAYDLNIWEKLVADGATRRSVTGDDYLRYGDYMTAAGKARWVTSIDGETLYDPVNGPGVFVLLPTIGDGYEWRPPAMRPNGVPAKDGGVLPADSFDVKEITLGAPESSLADEPTLKVVFDDYHVYEFLKDGQPHAVHVKRPWVMWLARTDVPEHPWLLEDWQVGPVEAREVAPVSEVGAVVEPSPVEPLPTPDGFNP